LSGSGSNEEVREQITRHVQRICFNSDPRRGISCGPLEINQFSICFHITEDDSQPRRAFYVKIPKRSMFRQKSRTILPLSEEDRSFGREEYHSLQRMTSLWGSGDLGVMFVRPIDYVEKYNAIISERFLGGEFYRVFRRQDTIRRLRPKTADQDPVHDAMNRIGKALARFHLNTKREIEFETEDYLKKIAAYSSRIGFGGHSQPFVHEIHRLAHHPSTSCLKSFYGETFKGIDIRNILVDPVSRSLCLLDPGKIKANYLEADLARFIVTCRILYWGTYSFFSGRRPDMSYEACFLRGYRELIQPNEAILKFLLIKEYFKHWVMALLVLDLKPWPVVIKTLLRYTYVDRFYRQGIEEEVAALGQSV
jgi:hypothetical protein